MAGRTLLEQEERKGPQGFFPKLYESVVTGLGEANMDKMSALKDGDTVDVLKFVHGLDHFRKGLLIREAYPEKNPYEYKAKKEYGNRAYQEGRDIDALYLYTQAVIAAPCDPKTGQSRELSVALANRSAVLFSLKAYYLAMDDIRLALESGYPRELRFKLLERKARIEAFYKQFSDAQDTYRDLLKALDEAKCEQDKKLKIQRDAQKMLDFFSKSKSGVYNDPNVLTRPPAELPSVEKKNKRFPAVSDCLTFRHAEGRGRFAVATRDISVGEFICVERPVVSRILPEYAGSNCANCFKAMKAPLPCPTCTKVMFCSYNCRKHALTTFHRYECKMIDFLIASGMSIICFLALRAVTSKSVKFFRDNERKFQDHDEKSGSDKSASSRDERYLSDDYRNLFNLVTHRSERKVGDVFHRAMLTVLLVRCLKKQGYFGEDRRKEEEEDGGGGDKLDGDELFVSTLLYHFLESMQFNSHEVAQFEMLAKNKEEGAQSVFIGAAVYPTLAMFNHSCDPSIVRFYVEDVVCVQAIKNVRKGEEICENYGPIFFHSNREDRQERLKKQYWFDCRCLPCVEGWPLMHEMTDDRLNFRCQDCNGAVPFETAANNPLVRCQCGTPVPMLQALKKISETDLISDKAKRAMEAGDLARAQDLYCDYLVTLDKYLVPPYQDYYKIQQSIWKCIWMRFGNRVITSKVRKAAPADDDYDTVD